MIGELLTVPTQTTIEPCPCGSDNVTVKAGRTESGAKTCWVECLDCGCKGLETSDGTIDVDFAADLWNRLKLAL